MGAVLFTEGELDGMEEKKNGDVASILTKNQFLVPPHINDYLKSRKSGMIDMVLGSKNIKVLKRKVEWEESYENDIGALEDQIIYMYNNGEFFEKVGIEKAMAALYPKKKKSDDDDDAQTEIIEMSGSESESESESENENESGIIGAAFGMVKKYISPEKEKGKKK